jgi:hypothetical protein
VDAVRGGYGSRGANLNTRTAYVGPTRGREDIQVYTNDKERMVRDLSRDVSHRSALEQAPPPHNAIAMGRAETRRFAPESLLYSPAGHRPTHGSKGASMNRQSSAAPCVSREQYEETCRLIRTEFEEMRGLVLTAPQAERLFDMEISTCIAIMDELVTSGFLYKTADGGYAMSVQAA